MIVYNKRPSAAFSLNGTGCFHYGILKQIYKVSGRSSIPAPIS